MVILKWNSRLSRNGVLYSSVGSDSAGGLTAAGRSLTIEEIMQKKAQKKVSEWLDDFEGHDICGAEVLANLKDEVGDDYGIEPVSKADMQKELDAEGRGGYLNGDGPYIPMLWIAEAVARKHDIYSDKFGRGSAFRDLVGKLKAAGL